MKKIFYKATLIVLFAGLFISCESELDQIPYDVASDETAYVTAADFENGIRGVYESLMSSGIYGSSDAGSMLSAPDVMSDNVVQAQKGRRTKTDLHNWYYTPSTDPLLGLYAQSYELIYRANLLLENAEDFEGDNKTNIVAEARALRGLAHLNLVSFWGKIPTQSSDAMGSLGIAYMSETDPNAEPARETVGEVYAKIVEDLSAAATNINSENPEGRMGKDAVYTLLSRVYLYMGQWQNAVDAANNVSTPIATRDEVVGVWEDANRAGLLLYIPNNPPVTNFNIGVAWSQGGLTNLIPEYVVSFEFFNKFSNEDIRKEAYIISASNNQDNLDFNAIKKLLGRDGSTNGLVDFKILRAEEAHLNKAEALYNLGQEGPARNTLDVIRNQRYTSYTGGESGTALRDAIRLERRLEFAFEYQRFFDLKRWGLPVTRTNAGDLADGSGTPSEVLTLGADSHKFQMPISQQARDQNPNLQQNPNY